MEKQPSKNSGIYKILFYVAVSAVFGILIFKLIQPFFGAILLGGVLALVGMPLKDFLAKYPISPSISAFLVSAIIILVIIIPVTLFTVQAVKEGQQYLGNVAQSDLGQMVQNTDAENFVADFQKALEQVLPQSISAKIPWDKVSAYGGLMLKSVIAWTVATASSLPDTIFKFIMAILTLFFLLRDGTGFVNWFAQRIPMEAKAFERLKQTAYQATVAATTGSFWAALVQSALIALTFFSLSIPAVILATGATFFFAWIPFLGSAPVWIAGLVYLGFKGLWVKFVILCFCGAFIGVSDNLVRMLPIFGDDGLHPLISLIAILGGINFFGFVGVIIGPAVVAVGLAFFDLFKKKPDQIQII